jgi:hypothetical protein
MCYSLLQHYNLTAYYGETAKDSVFVWLHAAYIQHTWLEKLHWYVKKQNFYNTCKDQIWQWQLHRKEHGYEE